MRRLADDDGIGFGDFLESRRQIWRFTDDCSFLGGALTDDVADRYCTCRHADAHMKIMFEVSHRLDDPEPRI